MDKKITVFASGGTGSVVYENIFDEEEPVTLNLGEISDKYIKTFIECNKKIHGVEAEVVNMDNENGL